MSARKPDEFFASGGSPPAARLTQRQRAYQERRKARKAAANNTTLHFDSHQFEELRHRDLHNLIKSRLFSSEDLARFQYIGRTTEFLHEKPSWMLEGREVAETYLRKKLDSIPLGFDKSTTWLRWLQVLERYYHRGYTTKDIADDLGMTVDSVKGIIKRLR